ncbi:uncharacterized protein FSUBG_13770 [Fusarium subglutinans]|uniref:Uncharacterized protein n=1 Tax=Gibberella subglutinans TaxID=42677 RepID=A0A8H5KRD0_GIBSU|nr:uncharacterized protein FSUBG_13770 [Fusarium subglutinans]KAF5578547.1 hypothetical protein FSUBG_13770 [Fusarium subglutinans]
MDHGALLRMVGNGLTFLAAHIAVKDNDKAWEGPHWLPKDVREAYKTDGKACDYSNIPDRVVYAIYHITNLLKDKSPESDLGSLWEAGGSLRLPATLPDGATFLDNNVAWGVYEEMKILMTAMPKDKDKYIYRAPHSQSSGSGIVPFPVQSNTALPDTTVARADDGRDCRLRLAKRKRAGTDNTNNPPFVVFEDNKPVPKVAKTNFRPADGLPTTNQENLSASSSKQIFCGTSIQFLESQQVELAETLKTLQHDIQQDLDESLREVETALTLETGGASNQEASYRLEGATLLRDRISNKIPSASADEFKRMEDDLRGLHESRRLILGDVGCIKDSMAAKIWYDETMSKLEKKAKTANWIPFMDGGDV